MKLIMEQWRKYLKEESSQRPYRYWEGDENIEPSLTAFKSALLKLAPLAMKSVGLQQRTVEHMIQFFPSTNTGIYWKNHNDIDTIKHALGQVNGSSEETRQVHEWIYAHPDWAVLEEKGYVTSSRIQ